MTREYGDYLHDILDAIEKVERFTKDLSFDEFCNDEKTMFAVIRALEIIGEATKNPPPSFKRRHSYIPWKKMAGMRDKLIHEYFGIDIKVVWQTVKDVIPVIKPEILKITHPINKSRR